jgi:class 3 adenylate cyclase
LRSIAHGGQVVVTRTVVDLVGGGLGDGLHFEHLGRHRVRDFDGWTDVYQVCGPGLGRDFPPLVTVDQGLPPIAAILMVDVAGARDVAARVDGEQQDAFMARIVDTFAAAFARTDGRYLKQVGDGCIGLFDDPDAALAFARSVRELAARDGLGLRSALHLGRVRFSSGEPIGRSIVEAAAALPRAPVGCIALTPAAAALVPGAPDLVATR